MSELSVYLDGLKNKASALEKTLNDLFAQHHSMQGMLAATKETIDALTKITNVVIPDSNINAVLNTAEEVIDFVDQNIDSLDNKKKEGEL